MFLVLVLALMVSPLAVQTVSATVDVVDDPEQLLANVNKAIGDFVQDAEQFDDITMLCLEYKHGK